MAYAYSETITFNPAKDAGTNYVCPVLIGSGNNPVEEGSWTVNGKTFQRRVKFTVLCADALTDYAVKVTVNTLELMRNGLVSAIADGDEVEFGDSTGTTTYRYWLVKRIWESPATEYWVKVTLEASVTLTCYLYIDSARTEQSTNYADFDDSGIGDLADVFVFGDCFERDDAADVGNSWVEETNLSEIYNHTVKITGDGPLHDINSKAHGLTAGTYQLEAAWLFPTPTGDDRFSVSMLSDTLDKLACVGCRVGTKDVKYINSAGWQTSSEDADDESYHKYQIKYLFDTDKADYLFNDISLATDQTPYPNDYGFEGKVVFSINGYDGDEIYLDYIFIRKVNATEPTVTFPDLGLAFKTVYLAGLAEVFPDDVEPYITGGAALTHYMEKKSATLYKMHIKVSSSLSSSPVSVDIKYGDSEASSQSNGANTFFKFDDFEGYDINDNPIAPWTYVEDGGGSCDIQADPTDGTNKVLRTVKGEVDDFTRAYIESINQYPLAIHFRFRFDGVGCYSNYTVENATAITTAAKTLGENILWYDGDSWEEFDPILTFAADTWYEVEDYIFVDDKDSKDFQIDVDNGDRRRGDVRNTPTVDIDNWYSPFHEPTMDAGTVYIDNVWIRPYVRAEPWLSSTAPKIYLRIVSSVSIGNVASASRSVAITKATSILIGNLVSATRIQEVVRTSSILIGNLVSAFKSRGVPKTASVLVGNLASASRVLAIDRDASVLIGTLVSASRIQSTVRASSVLIGNLISATRTWHRIHIGAPAINRATSIGPGNTLIAKENPANYSGTLTKVEIYATTALSGVKVGVFYKTDTNSFTCRDYVALGSVSSGWTEHTGLSIDVVTGDYIGIFFT